MPNYLQLNDNELIERLLAENTSLSYTAAARIHELLTLNENQNKALENHLNLMNKRKRTKANTKKAQAMGGVPAGDLVRESLKLLSEAKIRLEMMQETLNTQHPGVDD